MSNRSTKIKTLDFPVINLDFLSKYNSFRVCFYRCLTTKTSRKSINTMQLLHLAMESLEIFMKQSVAATSSKPYAFRLKNFTGIHEIKHEHDTKKLYEWRCNDKTDPFIPSVEKMLEEKCKFTKIKKYKNHHWDDDGYVQKPYLKNFLGYIEENYPYSRRKYPSMNTEKHFSDPTMPTIINLNTLIEQLYLNIINSSAEALDYYNELLDFLCKKTYQGEYLLTQKSNNKPKRN